MVCYVKTIRRMVSKQVFIECEFVAKVLHMKKKTQFLVELSDEEENSAKAIKLWLLLHQLYMANKTIFISFIDLNLFRRDCWLYLFSETVLTVDSWILFIQAFQLFDVVKILCIFIFETMTKIVLCLLLNAKSVAKLMLFFSGHKIMSSSICATGVEFTMIAYDWTSKENRVILKMYNSHCWHSAYM